MPVPHRLLITLIYKLIKIMSSKTNAAAWFFVLQLNLTGILYKSQSNYMYRKIFFFIFFSIMLTTYSLHYKIVSRSMRD